MSSSSYFSNPRPELVKFFPSDARRFLDVGCGEGTFAVGLRDRFGVEAWGVEIDETAASIAESRLDHVLCGDAVAMAAGVPDGYFDCVFLNDVLEHLAAPEDLLNALPAKLAPGGIVIASIPNVRHFWHLYDLIWHGRWEYADEGILDRTHLRFYTRSSMVGMFRRCGYTIDSIDGIHATGSLYFRLFNLLTLGRFADMRYLQFVCVVRPASYNPG